MKSNLKTSAKTNNAVTSTAALVTQVSRVNFFFIALYATSIIIFDSGNLIAREAVYQRWTLAVVLLIVNTFVWYITRHINGAFLQKLMVWVLVVTELIFAGYMIYWERGMASMSTLLFALPIVTAGMLLSRTATLATSTLAIATYSFAAMKYFYDYFNEGYRLQLYGQMVFFGGVFLTIAWIVNILARVNKNPN